MVTPQNFQQWFGDVKKQASTKGSWDFWEFCNGSGRLSLTAWQSGLVVGFPVDRRYGWNLHFIEHRKVLDAARNFFLPKIRFCAPDCSHGSRAGVMAATLT